MPSPAIYCRSLTKHYGQQVTVDGINLEVVPGICFGLLGPNGAGKTTTVEMLEGLTPADAGTIELFGLGWGSSHDQELRERIGVQLQETQLGDKLHVDEVIRLFRSFYPRGRAEEEVLALVDLTEERHKQYCKLSGGQKQRLALGCALTGYPELLFLDEPTTGLDPRARRALWSVVERFCGDGGTVLLTTHYMEEAAALCDQIAIMDRGQIIARGSPRSLIDGLGLVQFVEFETSDELDTESLLELPNVEKLDRRGAHVRLQASRQLGALRDVLAELERQAVTPVGLSTHQATLDDVFLHLTGRQLSEQQGPRA
jgi:ABC-2 type transport system ATP-binding protein